MSRQTPTTNMREVAKAAGVSRTAVYHVINNRPGEVSQETRDRILKVIREVGYAPPPRLSAVDQRKEKTVGLVIATDMQTLTNDDYRRSTYQQSMFHAILRATEGKDIHVTLFTGGMFSIDAAEQVRLYCDGRCDGMLLVGVRKESVLPRSLAERGTPFISIGSRTGLPGGQMVDLDNFEAIHSLCGYLVSQGHMRIAFRPGPDFVPAAEERAEAFFIGAREFNFEPIVLAGYEIAYNESDSNRWIDSIMSREKQVRPTAIIAWNGSTAVQETRRLLTIGVDVPGEITMACVDEIAPGHSESEVIIQYVQPVEEIAIESVDRLLLQFNGTFDGQVTRIPGKLKLPGSTPTIV